MTIREFCERVWAQRREIQKAGGDLYGWKVYVSPESLLDLQATKANWTEHLSPLEVTHGETRVFGMQVDPDRALGNDEIRLRIEVKA